MNDRVRDFLRRNLGYFSVFVLSALYVAGAVLQIDTSGKTLRQVLFDGALSFVFGVVINRSFELQGILLGERDERLLATARLHGETVLRISPLIEKLDGWCARQNRENLATRRAVLLARAGLSYDRCFDESGVARDPVLPRAAQRRAFRRACHLRLTPLTTAALTGEGGRDSDPFYLGRTKAEFERRQSLTDAGVKLLTAIIFGCFGVRLLENFSYAALLFTGLQTALFLCMGVTKLYRAYLFLTDEYRGRLVKKIDNLQKFENSCRPAAPGATDITAAHGAEADIK